MRFLAILGKFLISVGVGVLLFVAWTLWGTGFYSAQQQDRLGERFDRLPPFTAEAGEETGRPPPGFSPPPGQPVFRLHIPAIGLRRVVVEGVGVEELRLGPGHYPECRPGFPEPLCTPWPEVWPGEDGRVIISGHRTTYGRDFWDLDKLERGDEIVTRTRWGTFTYRVTRTEIVSPDSRAIVVESDRPELVLTTCNPRFSAAQRMIVFSELVES
jgi:sortase A